MNKMLLALTLLLAPLSVSAVVVGTLDWRQLTDTTSISYSTLATKCSTTTGACAGSVAGPSGLVSVDGWTWASETDVRSLFERLILDGTTQFSGPFPQTFGPTNSSDVENAIGATGFSATDTATTYEYMLGISRTLSAGNPLYAEMLNVFAPVGQDYARITNLGITVFTAHPAYGHWMYRTAPVPLPAAAWLLIAGIGGLGAMARRRRLSPE